MMKIDIGKLMQNQKTIIMKNKISLLIVIFLLVSTYQANAQQEFKKLGLASFYADKFEGRQTANGEIYYHVKKTAAHKTFPFGSIVKVTNLENNKYTVVRINDRGPFVENRIIDLSKSTARELDFIDKGVVKVKIELIASTNDVPDNRPLEKVKNQANVYYKVNVEAVSPWGKGVQVGSYSNDENVFRVAEELKQKYKEVVFIELATIKGKKVYRIIVGNYNSYEKLNILKAKLKKQYKSCFIVSFKNN